LATRVFLIRSWRYTQTSANLSIAVSRQEERNLDSIFFEITAWLNFVAREVSAEAN
jgi:hypothetical protein